MFGTIFQKIRKLTWTDKDVFIKKSSEQVPSQRVFVDHLSPGHIVQSWLILEFSSLSQELRSDFAVECRAVGARLHPTVFVGKKKKEGQDG